MEVRTQSRHVKRGDLNFWRQEQVKGQEQQIQWTSRAKTVSKAVKQDQKCGKAKG